MTGRVAQIWRHPIKSHGREALETVRLAKGRTMPWDRTWAVAQSNADVGNSEWAPCANFSRVAKAPALQAITAKLDEDSQTVTLTHPELPYLTFRPDEDLDVFLDWVSTLMPPNRMQSAKIVRVQDRGMTDTDFPSISLNNLSSNQAIARQLGTDISPLRWRGNFWFDGLEPWEEFTWVGKSIQLGNAEIAVRERIVRCLATAASPETGIRDVDTLGGLNAGWGHQEFGVYAEVIKEGDVSVGDPIEVLA